MHQLEVISLTDQLALIDRVVTDLTGAVEKKLTTQNQINIGLTGGRLGSLLTSQLLSSPLAQNQKVHFWWTDERFLPVGDDQRNDSAVPDHLVNQPNLHPLAAANSSSMAKASEIANQQLAKLGPEKLMDITLLSVGPDGHVASLFPNHQALTATDLVVAITDSPKPPKDRLTWTLGALNRSEQIWLLASGSEKLQAVTHLMAGDKEIPASNVHGLSRTVLYAEKSALLS